MTDEELLELAAKAIGMETKLLPCIEEPNRPYKRPWQIEDSEWNPLVDDGDALRLAVKLELALFIEPRRVRVGPRMDYPDFHFDADCDVCAATRRVIVLTAAHIGKAIP